MTGGTSDANQNADMRADWRRRLGASMMPVLFALGATLIALALIIAQTISAQQDARQHGRLEGDRAFILQNALQTMVDAETGQRGYLLTQDASYLEPYNDTKDRIARLMKMLRGYITEDPAGLETQRINGLEAATARKFAELDRSIDLVAQGQTDAALKLVQSQIGKNEMDAIREQVRAQINERLQNRRRAFDHAATLESRLLPLITILGIAIVVLVLIGFRTERRRADAAAMAEQASALREANDRSELLARELNHRVKNLFSVILSIISLSRRKQASSKEIVEDIRARVHALSLAHSVSQGNVSGEMVELRLVVERIMQPYRDEADHRVVIKGPDVPIEVRKVTPIGLILHELATNAAKYGALSADGGCVTIEWAAAAHPDGIFTLTWSETGGPALSGDGTAPASGFGAQMTAVAARQLGGQIEREWPKDGAFVRVSFPLTVR